MPNYLDEKNTQTRHLRQFYLMGVMLNIKTKAAGVLLSQIQIAATTKDSIYYNLLGQHDITSRDLISCTKVYKQQIS